MTAKKKIREFFSTLSLLGYVVRCYSIEFTVRFLVLFIVGFILGMTKWEGFSETGGHDVVSRPLFSLLRSTTICMQTWYYFIILLERPKIEACAPRFRLGFIGQLRPYSCPFSLLLSTDKLIHVVFNSGTLLKRKQK